MGLRFKILGYGILSVGLAFARTGEVTDTFEAQDTAWAIVSQLSRQMADVQSFHLAAQKAGKSSPKQAVENRDVASNKPISASEASPSIDLPLLVSGGFDSTDLIEGNIAGPAAAAVVDAFNDSGIGNLDTLVGNVDYAGKAAGGLPMALATVVPPGALIPQGGPQERKIKPKDGWLKNMGVVEGLQPKGETSFGGGGTDQGIFQKAKDSAGKDNDSGDFMKPMELTESEKAAAEAARREKFLEGLQEIGNLNPESGSIGWEEYFKAGDLLNDVDALVESIPKQDIDPGAINNLFALYERFGTRDQTDASQRFERILRHWDPDAIKFRAVAPPESTRVIGGVTHQNK